jgi:hypothetical protein
VLKKIALSPGINQENTRYTNENGWWVGDKVRFRQGTPEKIGGWQRISESTFSGVCRSVYPWDALLGAHYRGVGTHVKYYIENGGEYYDITPVRATASLTDPFATTDGLNVVTVTDTAHGALTGDSVLFSGATAVGGITLAGEYVVTVLDANTYTVVAGQNATSTATGGGTVTATYLLSIGNPQSVPTEGWGSGPWGLGVWGVGESILDRLRLWVSTNFGEDLVLLPRGGALYTWDVSAISPLTTRAVPVAGLPGASDVPVAANSVLVSDVSRFVIAFGCNDYGMTELDPLLIRWSDQESLVNWTPTPLNQAGSIRLSRGSRIVARLQMRQELLVFTDAALYSLQYQGPPIVWSTQLMGSSTTLASPNAAVESSGIAFWMGTDKFYVYNGQVQPLKCDVLRYVYDDLNRDQIEQVFAGAVPEYNEVWWFYPGAGSLTPNKYVIFNYVDNTWSMGTMTRFAWTYDATIGAPFAAGDDRLVQHEFGLDDSYTEVPTPIHAYIESAEFDIDDGDRFSFVRRVIPDITFQDSTAPTPSVTLTLYPMKSSGSGFHSSVGGVNASGVDRVASGTVERFTEQLNLRVRGRQLVMRIESNTLGTAWQAGAMRLDIRQDGGRG